MIKAIDDPDFVKYYEKNAIVRAMDFDKMVISKNLINALEDIYANYK